MNNNSILKNYNHYKILFEDAYDPILIIKEQHFIDCNKAALHMLNMSNKEDLFNIHPSEISPEFQPDGNNSKIKANAVIKECFKYGFNRFEWLHKTLDNKELWVEVSLKKISINGENILYVEWRDLKALKEYEELEKNNSYTENINSYLINTDKSNDTLQNSLLLLEEYKKIIDESSIVSKADKNGYITYVNDKFCSVSGYCKAELIGQNHNIVRHPKNTKSFFENLWKTISNKRIFKGIIHNRKKDGSSYYVDTTIMPIIDIHGNINEYISVRQDVTAIYKKDEIIYKQFLDKLTGLFNRQKLLDDISNSIFLNLAIVNINGFKDINDLYGIESGDKILKDFAKELRSFEADNITIYRIGADNFALLSSGNFTSEKLYEVCLNLDKKLEKVNFTIADSSFDISITIGLGSGREKLLNHTEMALSTAKKKNIAISVFNEKIDIEKEIRDNLQLTQDVKTALKNDNILLYGQKIINNSTFEIKYEVLMRMKLEDGTILAPIKFLEHSKKARLYPLLTIIMIDKACEYFKDKDITFSINLTIQDITNKKTVEFLINKLKQTKTTNKVILEIVESEGIERFEEVSKFIKKVKQLGCAVAIDDFGTGYSNFEYIIKLNMDILKIDGSLIQNIHKDKNLLITVSTIVNFAKALNIEVVAEFVHCKEVHEIVKSLGMDYSQGYLFHEPEHLINNKNATYHLS